MATTTIKIKGGYVKEINRCGDCPFLYAIDESEYGELTGVSMYYCGIMKDGEDFLGDTLDCSWEDQKHPNCPIISVEHEE